MRSEILEYLSCQDLANKTRDAHLRYLSGLATFAGAHYDHVPLIIAYLSTLRPQAKKRAWTILNRFFIWQIISGRRLQKPARKHARDRLVKTRQPGQ